MLKDAQDEALLETFFKAQADREVFLREPPKRREEAAVANVDSNQALMSMLVGGMMAKQIQRGKELSEPKREDAQLEGKEEQKRRPSFGDKVAEGVRRDLEKLEQGRAQKQSSASEQDSSDDEKT